VTEDQRALLLKAQASLEAAKSLHRDGFHGFAAARAYYAMFYVAQAFLEGEGLSFSKHAEVIGAFGLHFAKSGRLPRELHRYLRDAQDVRLEADYDYLETVTAERASEQIQRAEAFLAAAERYLGPLAPSEGSAGPG
jgi:uncharacterized protein (UPF0332 family)